MHSYNATKKKKYRIYNTWLEDQEIKYVELVTQKNASLKKIEVGNAKSIFTKLVDYPYEFEINRNLQLASINGIKVAENSSSWEMDELKSQINALEKKYDDMMNKLKQIHTLEKKQEELANALDTKKQSEILIGTINVPANSRNQGKTVKVTFDKPLDNTNYTCFVCTRAGSSYWAQNSYGVGEKMADGFVIYTWCWEGTTIEHPVD